MYIKQPQNSTSTCSGFADQRLAMTGQSTQLFVLQENSPARVLLYIIYFLLSADPAGAAPRS